MKIVLLFGGRGAEHAVSLLSAKHVYARLATLRHEILCVGMDRRGALFRYGSVPDDTGSDGTPVSLLFSEGKLSFTDKEGNPFPVDLVFSTIHGKDGEDGALQGVFTLGGVPFVGAGVAASAIGMNKRIAKELVRAAGVPVVPYLSVRAVPGDLSAHVGQKLRYPLFVKPVSGGSSIGVSRVENEKELASAVALARKEDEEALIEEAIQGSEIEVAVLEKDGTLLLSPPGEIRVSGGFYDYKTKYSEKTARFSLPAPLSEAECAYVKQLAATAFRTLGCRDMARVDFLRGEDGALFFNEINTLPGFTEDSLFPRLFSLIGVDPVLFLTEGRL